MGFILLTLIWVATMAVIGIGFAALGKQPNLWDLFDVGVMAGLILVNLCSGIGLGYLLASS